MSWTYSGSPGTTPLDAVRFWVQDTDEAFPQLADEEISYLISLWGDGVQHSEIRVAAMAAEVLSNRYAREVSTSADGVSVQLSELQQKYDTLAANLRSQWVSLTAYVGASDFAGIMLDQEWDDSIKPLVFGVGFMDNYEAGQQDYGYYSPGDYSRKLSSQMLRRDPEEVP